MVWVAAWLSRNAVRRAIDEAAMVQVVLSYRAWDRELHASLEQARHVPLERAREVELGEEPTIDEVRKLLRAVGLELPHAFGDLEVSDIIRRAISAPNFYE